MAKTETEISIAFDKESMLKYEILQGFTPKLRWVTHYGNFTK